MSLTPAEIRHLELGHGLFGYRRSTVDRALDDVVDSFEQVWRERADLADKVEQLENDMVRYKELETLLRTTLISAEKAAHELKNQARKEAELIVNEAHSEARSITREAAGKRERLVSESQRLEAMLRSVLATVESSRAEEPKPTSEPEISKPEAEAA
jgi:cell division initiation protein